MGELSERDALYEIMALASYLPNRSPCRDAIENAASARLHIIRTTADAAKVADRPPRTAEDEAHGRALLNETIEESVMRGRGG